jgi:hypothetical protein
LYVVENADPKNFIFGTVVENRQIAPVNFGMSVHLYVQAYWTDFREVQ